MFSSLWIWSVINISTSCLCCGSFSETDQLAAESAEKKWEHICYSLNDYPSWHCQPCNINKNNSRWPRVDAHQLCQGHRLHLHPLDITMIPMFFHFHASHFLVIHRWYISKDYVHILGKNNEKKCRDLCWLFFSLLLKSSIAESLSSIFCHKPNSNEWDLTRENERVRKALRQTLLLQVPVSEVKILTSIGQCPNNLS